jgi:hypothetical protein
MEIGGHSLLARSGKVSAKLGYRNRRDCRAAQRILRRLDGFCAAVLFGRLAARYEMRREVCRSRESVLPVFRSSASGDRNNCQVPTGGPEPVRGKPDVTMLELLAFLISLFFLGESTKLHFRNFLGLCFKPYGSGKCVQQRHRLLSHRSSLGQESPPSWRMVRRQFLLNWKFRNGGSSDPLLRATASRSYTLGKNRHLPGSTQFVKIEDCWELIDSTAAFSASVYLPIP